MSNSGKAELSSRTIGEMVMDRLRKLDRVAYIRFASVYRDFRDIESFRDEVDALLEPREDSEEIEQLSFLDDEELVVKGKRRRGRKPRRRALNR